MLLLLGSLLQVSAPVEIQLDAAPGAFTLVGQAATTVASRQSDAQPGAFSLSGQPAATLAARNTDAQPATFTLQGQSAVTLVARQTAALAGAFVAGGASSSGYYSRVTVASAGSFQLVGNAAALVPLLPGGYPRAVDVAVGITYGPTGSEYVGTRPASGSGQVWLRRR